MPDLVPDLPATGKPWISETELYNAMPWWSLANPLASKSWRDPPPELFNNEVSVEIQNGIKVDYGQQNHPLQMQVTGG